MTRWYPYPAAERYRPRGASWIKAVAILLAGAFAGTYYLWIPDVAYLQAENPKTTAYMQIYVRHALSRGKKPIIMMRWTPLEQISPFLQHAVLIEEDADFYRHGGVDFRSLEKAISYNMKRGKWARGASTITQQVARNLFLSPTRSKWRKAQEIMLAWKLEHTLTKDRILEIYLNIAEWGQGVYGAQAASQIYFGKPAKDVTPAEAIALATALPSPWRLNPLQVHGPIIEKKKEVILSRMRRAGYLPPEVKETEIEVPELPADKGRGD